VRLVSKLYTLKSSDWPACSPLQRLKQRAWTGLFCPQRKFKRVGGNRLAREEISTFGPKKVHIGTFIGQFSSGFGIIAQSFRFCELAFR
jgi:hypothetical protein